MVTIFFADGPPATLIPLGQQGFSIPRIRPIHFKDVGPQKKKVCMVLNPPSELVTGEPDRVLTGHLAIQRLLPRV